MSLIYHQLETGFFQMQRKLFARDFCLINGHESSSSSSSPGGVPFEYDRFAHSALGLSVFNIIDACHSSGDTSVY